MIRRREWVLVVVLALAALSGLPTQAQIIVEEESLFERINPFRAPDPAQPVSVIEFSKRLDCIAEKLRNDGLVVIKQPDVFSQARMTHFRNDFDGQMQTDLKMFHLVLAARINRLDSATTTQTTNLSAALSAPGTTSVSTGTVSPPTAPTLPALPANGVVAPGTSATLDPTKNAFSNLGLDTNVPNPAAALGLGVDPTVYLDEKKRFLEYLSQIRRINHGPDQNDSSGYGLYIIRLPVSITPGECTYQGHGAELAVTVEHEFPPDFLQSSFRNLVINDLVDHLGPVIYEVVRSGLVDKLKELHDMKIQFTLLDSEASKLIKEFCENSAKSPVLNHDATGPDPLRPLVDFFLKDLKNYPETDLDAKRKHVEARFEVLKQALRDLAPLVDPATAATLNGPIATLDQIMKNVQAESVLAPKEQNRERNQIGLCLDAFLMAVQASAPYNSQALALFKTFVFTLIMDASDDEIKQLGMGFDDAGGVLPQIKANRTARAELSKQLANFDQLKLSLPSTRNSKQRYPIAPPEVFNFFLEENIYLLATGAKNSAITQKPRLTDIRNYLRSSLDNAFDAMAKARPGATALAPLNNVDLMDRIYEAIKARDYGPEGRLNALFKELSDRIVQGGRKNIYDNNSSTQFPIAALCWAIAVDSVLLDGAFLREIPRTFAAQGLPDPTLPGMHFYFQDDQLLGPARPIYNDFVKYRWPIITFALDPVAEQQNVADSFNLQRDLQLALSYAFATGQINFGQLNTFRRQIQQSSDTIALNRTVTGFIHDDKTFGFRFTPRFQNPPQQRTNFGVIASQLIGGGPGPDYQMKKSKLEPGMRELTAIVLAPTFLPTMRMEVASNWFKLNDPEHLVFHTKRMLEQGRQVQELRQTVIDACSAQQYRDADLRVLQAKLTQLEAILPAQSKVVQLPFENSASGFDLFSDGATALVPELSGYDGVDTFDPSLKVATDIFVYGKYFDLLDTKVIVGGAYVPPSFSSPPTSGGYEILSREVIHVQIPTTAQATVTVDGKTYLELYVATPTGISNRILIPFQAATPAPLVAFDLNSDSQELDIFYQWFPTASPTATLIATNDPGKGGLKIAWDSPTAMAPKTLLATFTGTVNGQSLIFSLPANTGTQDMYSVDKQLMAVIILKRLQSIFPAPTPLPASFPMTVSVQPYTPQDAMGYRVVSKAKTLKTPLTVKLLYNATDQNALPGVTEPPKPAPAPKPAAADEKQASLDDSVQPARLQASEVPLPRMFQAPVSSLLPAGLSPPAIPATLAALAGNLPALPANPIPTATAALPNVGQFPPLPPSIVVHPPNVTVIAPSPPPVNPPQSRLSRLFHHKKKGASPPAR